MARQDQIRARALEIIAATPQGIRYSDLMSRLHEDLPEIPERTIAGSAWNLDAVKPDEVYKPARGVFRHIRFRETRLEEDIAETPEVVVTPDRRIREEDFYAPFAEWIKNELEECTKAIPFGGNRFRDRWGTPDVIGIRKSRQGDVIKVPTEVISVEIKIDTNSLITAFGQSCSYILFSHKAYIVVPRDASEEDIARLDALCRIFGIGLILFDATSPEEPNFQIRVRAAKHEPDMFYVNRNMRILENELFS